MIDRICYYLHDTYLTCLPGFVMVCKAELGHLLAGHASFELV